MQLLVSKKKIPLDKCLLKQVKIAKTFVKQKPQWDYSPQIEN